MAEIIISWNQAALETVVREVEFLHRLTLLYIQFTEHQQAQIADWQQHLWEIM